MGRNNKWIECRPDDSARRVARRALRDRLERMWHYLERAAGNPLGETEDVHQLRVFARRAAAAMEIFETWLPERRGPWMAKQIKRVRKAAGDARDIDVLLMRWRDRLLAGPSDEIALLLDEIKQHRHEAQRPIEQIHQKLLGKRFTRRVKQFVRRVHQRVPQRACDDRLDCLARASLGRLVVPYLEAARTELTDVQALHAFRIQSKQVRYAMEIFGGAFDETFRRDLYPLVADLQDRLGAINDHVTAHDYLKQWLARCETCATRHALEAGVQHEGQAIETSRQEFLAWWTADRRAEMCLRFSPYVQAADAQPGDGTTGPAC